MQYLTPFPGYRKTLILQRREEELRHALKHGAIGSKLQKAAERVRTAHLHRIKAFQSALADRHPSDPLPDEQLTKFAQDADAWEIRSTDEIIAHYKRREA
jgi:hypothetical protein